MKYGPHMNIIKKKTNMGDYHELEKDASKDAAIVSVNITPSRTLTNRAKLYHFLKISFKVRRNSGCLQ